MTEPAPPWWQSFVDGELAGFAHLIEAYQRHVLAVAVATVIDRSLAEDVVQETFLAAHAHRTKVREPAMLGRWLASIARNKGRDMVRAQRREALTDGRELEIATREDSSPHHDIESAAMRSELAEALARVPASLREALVLYYAHDHSAEHVARELGLSEAATMQRLSRGRKLMRHYAAALEEYVRPRRGAAAAVVALLAIRGGTAHAATTRAKPPGKLLAIAATSVTVVFGWTLVDYAAARATAPLAPNMIESEPVRAPAISSANAAPPTRLAPAAVIRPERAPRPPGLRVRIEAAAHVEVDTRVGVAAAVTAPGTVPAVAVEPSCPCPGALAIPARRWDPVNAFVETAAMPRTGEVMFEMMGLDWITRVGVGKHVAAHVAFTPIATRVGDHRNANPAFGAGLKVGGQLTDKLSLAVIGEAAYEVQLNTLSLGSAWIGRSYASLTHGDARNNVTASAGVVAYDNRSDRWVVPMLALGTQLGWDDRLAFVVESQVFVAPLSTLSTTTAVAVRFRQNSAPSLLGIERTRIDLGAVYVDTTDADLGMAPWLQVGFGW